jgi:hypothetical protein
MSSMLQNFINPLYPPTQEERMARINEDPSLKHVLYELETGGPAAMMRSKYHFIFLTKNYQFFKIIFYCFGISIFPPSFVM